MEIKNIHNKIVQNLDYFDIWYKIFAFIQFGNQNVASFLFFDQNK